MQSAFSLPDDAQQPHPAVQNRLADHLYAFQAQCKTSRGGSGLRRSSAGAGGEDDFELELSRYEPDHQHTSAAAEVTTEASAEEQFAYPNFDTAIDASLLSYVEYIAKMQDRQVDLSCPGGIRRAAGGPQKESSGTSKEGGAGGGSNSAAVFDNNLLSEDEEEIRQAQEQAAATVERDNPMLDLARLSEEEPLSMRLGMLRTLLEHVMSDPRGEVDLKLVEPWDLLVSATRKEWLDGRKQFVTFLRSEATETRKAHFFTALVKPSGMTGGSGPLLDLLDPAALVHPGLDDALRSVRLDKSCLMKLPGTATTATATTSSAPASGRWNKVSLAATVIGGGGGYSSEGFESDDPTTGTTASAKQPFGEGSVTMSPLTELHSAQCVVNDCLLLKMQHSAQMIAKSKQGGGGRGGTKSLSGLSPEHFSTKDTFTARVDDLLSQAASRQKNQKVVDLLEKRKNWEGASYSNPALLKFTVRPGPGNDGTKGKLQPYVMSVPTNQPSAKQKFQHLLQSALLGTRYAHDDDEDGPDSETVRQGAALAELHVRYAHLLDA